MQRTYVLAILQDADGGFVRQFLAEESRVTLRAYTTPTAYLTVRDSHPVVGDVMATGGARCQVWMITVDEGRVLERELLIGGRVGEMTGQGPFGQATIPVTDDLDLLEKMLGWQVPTAPASGQGAAEYAVYTGPTETRIKAAVAANAARLGLAWDVVPSRGAGTDGRLELRANSSVWARSVDALKADRLVPSVVRGDDGRWMFDIREGETFPRPITPQSGVLGTWRWKAGVDQATRVMVGGRGEGTAREFKVVIDAAREARVGYPLEVFTDARQTEEGADITPSGQAKLDDTAARSGLTAELQEASWFRFPASYGLGTRLQVQIGAVAVDDIVTQIEVTHDTKQGFRVVPRIGLSVDDPQERLIEQIRDIATATRGLEGR